MTIKLRIFAMISVLVLNALACTFAGQAPATQPPMERAITEMAGTLQAQQTQLAGGGLLAPSPIVLPSETPPSEMPLPSMTPSITLTPTITLTATLSVPMVSVSEDTNCRSGPGVIYDYLGALTIGEKAEVVGKNSENNYWVIKNPDYAGTCWLWGRYATVEGNTSGIPEWLVPSTPTPSIPAAPSGLSGTRVCKTILLPAPHVDMVKVTLTWTDQANNEEGYNIYRDGTLVATLGPNEVTYIDNPTGIASATYAVEAFNTAGASARKKITLSCP